MQHTSTSSVTRQSAVPPSQNDNPSPPASGQWAGYQIIRRNGAVVSFEPGKIAIAMTKAFLAVNGGQGAASARVRELVDTLTRQAVNALVRNRPNGGTFHIEDVQDQVELALMRSGEHDVARAYVLYRERRDLTSAIPDPFDTYDGGFLAWLRAETDLVPALVDA